MNFRKVNNITGWVVFLIALLTYFFTRETAGSLWDCGEFVASADKLQNPHPPGAPLFVLIGRFFIVLFGGGNPAGAVNLMSATVSAITILFLFWTITHFARKMFVKVGEDLDNNQLFTVMAAGVVGALAYTYCDSFWFSAVEGEVYALSSFFTALAFWAALKWEHADEHAGDNAAKKAIADRWIVFVFFSMGLSIGVHLLGILTIPAIVMIYYFRRFTYSVRGALLAFIVGCLITGIVQVAAIQYSMKTAGLMDIFAVNSLGLPFFSGFALYFVILGVLIFIGLRFRENKLNKTLFVAWLAALLILLTIPFFAASEFGAVTVLKILLVGAVAFLGLVVKPAHLKTIRLVLWCFAFMMLGYSMYFVTMIRSNANPAIDMNNVDNPMNLVYYLSREQYGSAPIVYGPHYMARPVDLKEGEMKYYKGKDRYIETGREKSYVYASKDMKLFPRIWDASNDQNHRDFYIDWLDLGHRAETDMLITGVGNGVIEYQPIINNSQLGQKQRYVFEEENEQPIPELRTDAPVRAGETITMRKPEMSHTIDWFIRYQNGLMFWRYFMWNFSGKQNDLQGYGNARDGNWISGIPFIDNVRLGDQSKMPELLRKNRAHNTMFMIPFILGILGCIFHILTNKKDWWVNMLLFFFTGFAIVIYLNQPGNQPRERDYAYVGAFYAFAVWIGLAVPAIYKMVRNQQKSHEQFIQVLAYGAGVTFFITMLSSNYGSAGVKGAFIAGFFAAAVYAAVVSLIYFLTRALSGNGVKAGPARYAAAVIGIIAPLLMAQQVWNDHDRNGKKIAVDLARAYLESCDKNAILFTFGDNDTYPLWYAQEVEGVRPDIRIINNSLLGIDWYINQLRYKINESDPIDVIWDEDQIAGEKRVYLRTQDDPNAGANILYDYMKNVMGKRNADGSDIEINYENFKMATRFFVPVDSAVYTNGTVNKTDSVYQRMEFQIPAGSLQRNDFAILNIIAANKWKRPIYFTSPYGTLGFYNYLRKDGLSYRLVPVKTTDRDRNWTVDRRVRATIMDYNKDFMTKALLEKFAFTSAKGTYFDEENRHHILNMRTAFAEAAGNAADEGDQKTAQALMQKAEKDIPESAMPYAMPSRDGIYHNSNGLVYLEALYKAGLLNEANRVKAQIQKSIKEEQEYYSYLTEQGKAGSLQNTVAINNALLEFIPKLEERYAKAKPAGPAVETPGGPIESGPDGANKDTNK